MTDWITEWNYDEYLTRQPNPMHFSGGEAGIAFAKAFSDWQVERAVVNLAKKGHDTPAQRRLWATEVTPTAGQRKATEILMALTTKERGGGVILQGLPGVGKSRLAGRYVNNLREAAMPTAYLSATQMLEQLTEIATSDVKGETAAKYRFKFATAPALIIDDLGQGKTSEFRQSQLHALLHERHNLSEIAPVLTVVTTNLTPAKLKAYMGDPAYSRLIGLCPEEFKITGKDMRKDKA